MSTFVAIFVNIERRYYLTQCSKDKRVHAFLKGISPKVIVISQLEYELAYFEPLVKHNPHSSARINPYPKFLK